MPIQNQKRQFKPRPPFELRAHIRDFDGNPKYPRVAGDDMHTFDDDRKRLEFFRCASDPAYFLANYCIIRHPLDGLVPFIPYGYQVNAVIPGFLNNRFAITRKFRQGGFSTIAAGLCLWISQFDLDREMLVVSKGHREAGDFLQMIYGMFDYLPAWLRSGYGVSNVHRFELDTGCRILAYSPTVGVSYGCYLLVVDEAGRVRGMEEKWRDMFPVLSTGGRCWVISTCNGMGGIGGWYYKRWTSAQNGDSNFFPIDVPYTDHPEYSDPRSDYVEKMKAELGELGFRQEVLREFLGVKGGVFREDLIRDWDDRLRMMQPIAIRPCPLLPKTAPQKNLFIWEAPQPGVQYIMAVDVGAGLGSNNPNDDNNDEYDSSVVQMLRADNLAQVLEYRNNAVAPPDFARVVCTLGHLYGNATLVCEDSPYGQHLLQTVHRSLGYSNIYCSKPGKLGLAITEAQRQMIYSMLIDIITARRTEVRSIRVINEMRTLIKNPRTGKIEHDTGAHDDCLTALGYGYFARHSIMEALPPMSTLIYKDLYAPTAQQDSYGATPAPALPVPPPELDDAAKAWNEWGGFPSNPRPKKLL